MTVIILERTEIIKSKMEIVDAYIKNIRDYRKIWNEINDLSRKWFNEHEEELLKKHTDENDYLPSILFEYGAIVIIFIEKYSNQLFYS